MGKTKGNVFIQSLKAIAKGLFKLLMLGVYLLAKGIELLANLIAKITEKFTV